MHHELKIDHIFYVQKKHGLKLFEIRYNGDRGFQTGDTISYIRSYAPFTKYDLYTEIVYITNFNQKENFIVFGEIIISEPIFPVGEIEEDEDSKAPF